MSASTLLVFARCAGFAFRAPGISHPSVPRMLRAGLAMALAVAIAPSVPRASLNGVALMIALALEFALGTAIGMSASLLCDAAYAGGRMLDDYVGVKAIAPSVHLVAPSGFGRIWSLAFTTAFLLLGAYRPVILGLASSFERISPGVAVPAQSWLSFCAGLAETFAMSSLSVAAPAIALAFVVHVALAGLARTVPRFSSFALSFPLVFAAVIVVTAVSLPVISYVAGRVVLQMPGFK